MKTTKTNNLGFYNDQGILTLTAKQFDTGRLFIFHIMDNDMPLDLSGCTAYLRIAKADGTQFQGHECCIVERSKIIINTSVGNGNQILTAAGTNVCELHLKDANDIVLTTWTFHIIVEPRVHNGSHMSSIDSYDVLDNMIIMEKERIANEKQRKENEENRKAAFEQKIGETNSVITECRLVIDTANQKISSFDEQINEIVNGITDEAQSYANNAKASETNAKNAASNAENSANTASQKASDAAASATLSQSYAVGGTGLRNGEDSDNAKEYARQAKASTDELQEKCILKTEKGAAGGVATLGGNGKIPKGQLPDDIGSVTGIKGDKESAYRTGNVNITAENIGAVEKGSDGYANVRGAKNAGYFDVIVNPETKAGVTFFENGIIPYIPYDQWLGNFDKPFATLISTAVEFIPTTNAGHGGVIDFHYNGDNRDYTSRIIESSRGAITFETIKPDNSGTDVIHINGGKIIPGKLFYSLGTYDNPFGPLHLYQETTKESGDKLSLRVRSDILNSAYNVPAMTFETWDAEEGVTYTVFISGGLLTFINSDYSDDITTINEVGVSVRGFGRSLSLSSSSGTVRIGSRSTYIVFEAKDGDGYFSPSTLQAHIDIGRATHKWKDIYATNGTIQTSDRNEKNTIEELTAEKAQQLIYGLKPSTYKMNIGTSNRTHWGMISQDIEELFEEIGMTSLDFAGFIKSPKMHIEEEERDENGKVIKEKVEEVIEGEYNYSLRYDEFIAPIIKVIQTQHEKIEKIEQKISLMERQMSDLLNKENKI